jgi:hypothetical protein
MTTDAEDKERIVQYLLGALPEAEAERLDELSVSDRAFAQALSAAEHDLVDAHARGELTGDRLDRFRSYYLASPLRREKASFARALQEFGDRHAVSRGVVRFGLPAAGSYRWMLAAVLTLAAVASWLFYQNARLRQQVSALEAHRAADARPTERNRAESVTGDTARELTRLRQERERLEKQLEGIKVLSVVLTPQLRSARRPQAIAMSPDATHVALQLALDPGDYSTVRVDLLDASGRRILWSSDALAPRATPDGRVADVTVRAELLRPDRYLLRVTALLPSRAAGILGDYPLAILRE